MNHFTKYKSSSRRMGNLNSRKTGIHGMHPLVKILVLVLYLAFILSYSRYDLNGLILFFAYPILVILMAEIPIRDVINTVLLTLPFILAIGISNLILDRTVILEAGGMEFTGGIISFLTLLLKTVMSVSAVYLLVATTEYKELMKGLGMLHIPDLFLAQLELMVRYMGVLAEEAGNMYHAYRLRTPGIKGVMVRHMGAFLGQLLLKSIYRAERIYHAMECRGYRGTIYSFRRERLNGKDYLQLVVISLTMTLCRFLKVF